MGSTDKIQKMDPISVLRVIGTLSVFCLHTTSYENNMGAFFEQGELRFLFRTPAWSAVWIFLILSGYLCGKGYASRRYTITWADTKRYYIQKFKKVMIPTFAFIFVVLALLYPKYVPENPGVLLKFITFTYDSTPKSRGISATWYIFTLFWLYLIAPLAAGVLDKLKRNRAALWFALVLLALASLAWRTYACFAGLEWNKYVYVPPVCNLDLYVGGMILAYLREEKGYTTPRRSIKILVGFFFAVLFVSNCYVYNRALIGDVLCSRMCKYFYQTLYLIACLIYLAVFDTGVAQSVQSEGLNSQQHWLKGLPAELLNDFAKISFEFYLFHCMILDQIAKYIVPDGVPTVFDHLMLLGCAGIISAICAACYHKIFEMKQWREEPTTLEKQSNLGNKIHHLKRIDRSSNIEFLRVVCMILLIAHHCICHGGAYKMENGINKFIGFPFMTIGKICFYVFVAISAWYTVDSKFKASRFVRTWLQILFYNVAIMGLTVFLGSGYAQEITWRTWLGAFFPIIGNSHGYGASYAIYYLCTPFLHYVTERATKRQTALLIGALFLTQVFSTLLGKVTLYTQPMSSLILLFVLCHFIAFYLKRWPIKLEKNIPVLGLIALGIWVVSTGFVFGAAFQPENRFYSVALSIKYSNMSLSNIIGGFAVFLLFKNLKMPKMPRVNVLASTTFGILLFHDYNYFRPVVWGRIIQSGSWLKVSPPSFVLHLIFSIVVIFTLGALIDFARQKLIETPIIRSKWFFKVCSWFDDIMNEQSRPNETNGEDISAL